MSGICGIINFDRADRLQETFLGAMAVSMRGTGSEEVKKTVWDNSGIGIVCGQTEYRWLCDDGLIVAAVGELYSPESTSIAKSVAEAYRLYGEECVEHMDGNFAFCLWDKKLEKLLVATDRFGTSVINYYQDDKCFY